ncbi:MAG: hypothetical protein RLZZ127_1738 [Planctomycetota bacterium]|jgi:hypothetical protein
MRARPEMALRCPPIPVLPAAAMGPMAAQAAKRQVRMGGSGSTAPVPRWTGSAVMAAGMTADRRRVAPATQGPLAKEPTTARRLAAGPTAGRSCRQPWAPVPLAGPGPRAGAWQENRQAPAAQARRRHGLAWTPSEEVASPAAAGVRGSVRPAGQAVPPTVAAAADMTRARGRGGRDLPGWPPAHPVRARLPDPRRRPGLRPPPAVDAGGPGGRPPGRRRRARSGPRGPGADRGRQAGRRGR